MRLVLVVLCAPLAIAAAARQNIAEPGNSEHGRSDHRVNDGRTNDYGLDTRKSLQMAPRGTSATNDVLLKKTGFGHNGGKKIRRQVFSPDESASSDEEFREDWKEVEREVLSNSAVSTAERRLEDGAKNTAVDEPPASEDNEPQRVKADSVDEADEGDVGHPPNEKTAGRGVGAPAVESLPEVLDMGGGRCRLFCRPVW